MNGRITMSEQKRTWLTFMGIAALCVAGVLTFLTHFASQNISGSLAPKITLVATWSVGVVSFWANMRMSGRLGVARAAQRRAFGTALAFGVIYLGFATLLFWSVYSSSEEIRYAGDAAWPLSLAFILWDTWRGSRRLPGRLE